MRYLAFDIEIVKEIPEGETDWKAYRPLGISCAATLGEDDEDPYLWWHANSQDAPTQDGALTQLRARSLVHYLRVATAQGYTILTWNGLGFDFDILAEESGMLAECRELALGHVDMMFHFFCLQGYPVSLQAVAKGLRLEGKTEGMSGDLAPKLWAAGEYDKVLEYVAQDVRTTLEVARRVEAWGGYTWITRNGNSNRVITERLLTVAEALKLPEPDTSWMSNPWPRSRFTGWFL